MNDQKMLTDASTPSTPLHAVPAVAGIFNLQHEIDELRGNAQYTAGGHAARTLVRLASFRVVLFVLRGQTEFKHHHTAQPMTLQMLTGRIRITLRDRWIEQGTTELVVIEPDQTHDLTALVDSAFLLSMPWSERVGT